VETLGREEMFHPLWATRAPLGGALGEKEPHRNGVTVQSPSSPKDSQSVTTRRVMCFTLNGLPAKNMQPFGKLKQWVRCEAPAKKGGMDLSKMEEQHCPECHRPLMIVSGEPNQNRRRHNILGTNYSNPAPSATRLPAGHRL